MTPEHYVGRIAGIKEAVEVMRANAADEFDRALVGRVVAELNKRLADLLKAQAAPPPAPCVQQPPQPRTILRMSPASAPLTAVTFY
jgi:hypothetical protein